MKRDECEGMSTDFPCGGLQMKGLVQVRDVVPRGRHRQDKEEGRTWVIQR